MFQLREYAQLEGPSRPLGSVLHVGCIFDDLATIWTYDTIGCCVANGEDVPSNSILHTEIYSPTACCFGNHTRNIHQEAVVRFRSATVINNRVYCGAYLRHPYRERCALLEKIDDSAPPTLTPLTSQSRDEEHEQQHVLRAVVLPWIMDAYLRELAQGGLCRMGQAQIIVPWYRALQQLKALRSVCRYFAYAPEVQCAVARMHVPVRYYYSRAPTCTFIPLSVARVSYTNHTMQMIEAGKLPGVFVDAVNAVIERATRDRPQRQEMVDVVFANFHTPPLCTAKCVQTQLRFNATTLHGIFAKLEKLADFMEYCGHGFNGAKMVLRKYVVKASNKKQLGVLHRLMVLRDLLTERRKMPPLYFGPSTHPPDAKRAKKK